MAACAMHTPAHGAAGTGTLQHCLRFAGARAIVLMMLQATGGAASEMLIHRELAG